MTTKKLPTIELDRDFEFITLRTLVVEALTAFSNNPDEQIKEFLYRDHFCSTREKKLVNAGKYVKVIEEKVPEQVKPSYKVNDIVKDGGNFFLITEVEFLKDEDDNYYEVICILGNELGDSSDTLDIEVVNKMKKVCTEKELKILLNKLAKGGK